MASFNRRVFMKGSLAALPPSAGRGIVDTSVYLSQWPFRRSPAVDLSPLPALLESVPRARVAVATGFQTVSGARQTLARLAQFDGVAVDFARMDALMELRALIETAGIERVVFGSYSPMFYFESAALKMREADLSETETRAIHRDNVRRMLGR